MRALLARLPRSPAPAVGVRRIMGGMLRQGSARRTSLRRRRLAFWAPCVLVLAACGEQPAPIEPGIAAAVPTGIASLHLPFRAETVELDPGQLPDAFARLAGTGVDVHVVPFENAGALLLLAVDLAVLRPQVVGTDGGQRVGVTAREALTEFGLELVVGSSFVSELNSTVPVGLLQIEGQTISELQRHGYTRVLGVRDEQLGVVGFREYHRGMFASAMQVGPGVVEQGLLDISERDLQRPRYFRTFVATCGGFAVVGASQVPMHLYTLGKRFLEHAQGQGWNCDEVANLAGDREVVLAMASRDREEIVYLGHPGTSKAGLVGFRRR